MAPDTDRRERRKIVLSLSFTTVLTFVFLVIAAMSAAYIWGVMSGRHLDPDVSVKAESPATPLPVTTPEDSQAPVSEILKPQELDFVHALRGDTRPVLPGPEAAHEEKVLPAQAPEPDAQASAEAPATSAGAPQPPAADAGQSGAYFDYVFQVAALKDERAADSLREKLEGRGLRTRMERSGKLLIVLTPLRGDAVRAAEVYAIMRELRLGEPLLRSKKPVAP